MSENTQSEIDGKVTHVFAHRFVVETSRGPILADLGPKGADAIAVRVGDSVALSGDMKPSELKVQRIGRNGSEPVAVEHKKPHEPHDDHAPADPEIAVKSVTALGYSVVGEPRRKPKHFEILGRNRSAELSEFHVELDGHIRKTKPVALHDPKWMEETRPTT